MFNEKNLLTVNEVALVVGIQPSTILKWVQHKKITFVRFGKGKSEIIRFDPETLGFWTKDISMGQNSISDHLTQN